MSSKVELLDLLERELQTNEYDDIGLSFHDEHYIKCPYYILARIYDEILHNEIKSWEHMQKSLKSIANDIIHPNIADTSDLYDNY